MGTPRTLTISLLVLVGLVAAAIVVIALLMVERGETNARLQNVRDDLHAIQQELMHEVDQRNTLISRVDGLAKDLATADARNQELSAFNEGLGTELQDAKELVALLAADNRQLDANLSEVTNKHDDLEQALAEEKNSNAELTKSNTQLEMDLSTAATRYEELEGVFAEEEASSAELAASNIRLETDLQGVKDRYDQTSSELEETRDNFQVLEQLVGTMEDLEARTESLREEIQDLEYQRQPLILDSRLNAFACTGSMEPKITCLDEATWLHNWKPDDIVIGATISFEPTEECDLDGDRIAHRVIDIRVADGMHYFWPKGDASDEPDGCWIPETNVDGYIIGIHKNTRLENTVLRDSVNAAFAELDEANVLFDEASIVVDEAEDKTDEAQRRYETRYEAYCGFHPDDADEHPRCTLPASQVSTIEQLWDEWSAAYDQYEEAYDKYEAVFNQYEATYEYAECWADSAENALYREGYPPLYVHCQPLTIVPPL